MNIYEFDDGETHWIAAPSLEKAISYFEEECSCDCEEYHYEVTLLTGEVLDKLIINNDESPEDSKYYNLKYISLNQALELALIDKEELELDGNVCLLAATIY